MGQETEEVCTAVVITVTVMTAGKVVDQGEPSPQVTQGFAIGFRLM